MVLQQRLDAHVHDVIVTHFIENNKFAHILVKDVKARSVHSFKIAVVALLSLGAAILILLRLISELVLTTFFFVDVLDLQFMRVTNLFVT